MSIQLHARTLVVARCRNRLGAAVNAMWEDDELTAAEIVHILASLTSEYTKYCLRSERHPEDPNKKADEA